MPKESKVVAKTATESLVLHWQKGYFKSWRDSPSIVDQLGKNGYNFSSAEFGMALMRAKHLTRRGKRGQYQYIQKYPYAKNQKEK